MPSFRCVVAIPTRELFSGDIEYANIPGSEGDFGVLSNHESFVGINRTGVLKLKLDADGKDTKEFLISGGITQVLNNHLAVLPRHGTATDAIDVDEVKAKMEALKAKMEETKSKEDDVDKAVLEEQEAHMAWYEAKLKYGTEGKLI